MLGSLSDGQHSETWQGPLWVIFCVFFECLNFHSVFLGICEEVVEHSTHLASYFTIAPFSTTSAVL